MSFFALLFISEIRVMIPKKKKNTIQFKRDKNGKRHSIQAILKGLGLKIYYMNQVLELRKLVLIQFCEYKIKGR